MKVQRKPFDPIDVISGLDWLSPRLDRRRRQMAPADRRARPATSTSTSRLCPAMTHRRARAGTEAARAASHFEIHLSTGFEQERLELVQQRFGERRDVNSQRLTVRFHARGNVDRVAEQTVPRTNVSLAQLGHDARRLPRHFQANHTGDARS